ncbi:alpha/beta fold hydrolase [Sphingosinithalassobacter portus]|uniref:alpha/beta fold hydrolase n=1 Tax=Stakelama portus TaxID=2676234 RepID=UPI000D6DCB39|nr:alpha/beta fold hydrolase [Sphingosinithalassobacter portus]
MRTETFHAPDGVRLTADVDGPDGAPTVILMHGGGQTRHSWSGAMRALVARGYRVINYDARGHGESDWSDAGAYMLDDRVDDLRAIVARLDVPYALVGASLGGATSIHAVAQGLRPAAVVLVDIVPNAEPEGVQRIVGFMRGHVDGFGSIEEAADAVAAYNPARRRPRDPTGLMRNLRLRDDGRLYWHWDPQIVATDPEHHHRIVVASAQEMARQRDLPIMVVRGLRSDVVSEAGVAAFRSLVPQLEVVNVAGAGHMVAGDRNDAFNAGVLEFLARAMPVDAFRP